MQTITPGLTLIFFLTNTDVRADRNCSHQVFGGSSRSSESYEGVDRSRPEMQIPTLICICPRDSDSSVPLTGLHSICLVNFLGSGWFCGNEIKNVPEAR